VVEEAVVVEIKLNSNRLLVQWEAT